MDDKDKQTKTEEVVETKPEVSAPEPLPPVKSKRNKVAITIIAVVLLLAILICGGFFGVSYYLTQQQMKGLKKVENNRLVFFYPDNFESKEANEGEFVYSNKDKNKYGGNSSIRTMDSDSVKLSDKIKDTDTCKKFAEGTLEEKKEEDQGKIIPAEEVKYSEFGGIKSCVFRMTYSASDFGKEGNIILKAKVIVKNNDSDAVVASYDDSTGSDEADKLNRAVELFSFK